MNKQRQENEMTTYAHIDISTIVHSFIRSQCYRTVRARHKISYNCITVLLGCYLFTLYQGRTFKLTPLSKFVGYYSYHLFVKYINRLVSNDLLISSGREYSITELGYSAVAEISNNNDNILYTFCSKYNIEL